MSREVLYEDGSGPRCKVEYDSAPYFDGEDHTYVRIHGVGGDVLVRVSDIPMLTAALDEAARLDEQVRAASAKHPPSTSYSTE